MTRSSAARSLFVVVTAVALAMGCSSDKKDDSKKTNKTNKTNKTPGKTKTPPKTKAGGSSCSMITSTPADGSAKVEHVAGKDDMSLDVKDGSVSLRTGSVGSGSNLRIQLRGSYTETEFSGRKMCIAFSRLTFVLPRSKPVVNKEVAYKFEGAVKDFARRGVAAIYVDINEKKKVAGASKTIEYMGATGTFKFTKLNEAKGKEHTHTLSFSVVFHKVKDDKLDAAVQTKLSGEFSFTTMSPL